MRPILVAALVMCTLTACKMGPDYSRPETSPAIRGGWLLGLRSPSLTCRGGSC
jgi:hypothetical protein